MDTVCLTALAHESGSVTSRVVNDAADSDADGDRAALGFADVADDDLCALAGELTRVGFALPPGPSRDEGDLAVQSAHRDSSFYSLSDRRPRHRSGSAAGPRIDSEGRNGGPRHDVVAALVDGAEPCFDVAGSGLGPAPPVDDFTGYAEVITVEEEPAELVVHTGHPPVVAYPVGRPVLRIGTSLRAVVVGCW